MNAVGGDNLDARVPGCRSSPTHRDSGNARDARSSLDAGGSSDCTSGYRSAISQITRSVLPALMKSTFALMDCAKSYRDPTHI